ncbi:hypothetical protein Bca4012_023274 [Brassica carinata]
MSLAMDKALMALSLDEEEVPFAMPELPEFSSAAENKLSLMGRILNPHRQKMAALIMKMPRKWQKEGKVRGIALSQERFQFIFDNEHDLRDVLDRGVHTFEEWVIVLERWVETPPEDYLQYIPLWVQIRDIPVNCYTTEALTALGDLVGKTVLVAFDPKKPITQDFIRVLVKFNVAHPLKTSRVITIKGKPATVRFNYERIQKRCFTCQRLNHENDHCPLKVRKRQEDTKLRRETAISNLEKKKPVLLEEDILFGVLEEEQVNLDPTTGRWKIAKEVLEEMRRYLLADTGESHAIKVDKVQRSVKLAEKDPMTQRLALRLEDPPRFTSDLSKGKGIVFDYVENREEIRALSVQSNPNKFMASALRAQSFNPSRSAPDPLLLLDASHSDASSEATVSVYPTVFKAGSPAPCSSGRLQRKVDVRRRRPPKSTRQQRYKERTLLYNKESEDKREGKQTMSCKKRKCVGEEEGEISSNKAVCLKAVPKEGLPHSQ